MLRMQIDATIIIQATNNKHILNILNCIYIIFFPLPKLVDGNFSRTCQAYAFVFTAFYSAAVKSLTFYIGYIIKKNTI